MFLENTDDGNSSDAAFQINNPWSDNPEIPNELQHWCWNTESETAFNYDETIYGVDDCCFGDNANTNSYLNLNDCLSVVTMYMK